MAAELVKIKSVYDSLSRTQKRLAEYILKNGEQIPFLSVHELALVAKVSVATVSRFAQALGYRRFKDFKTRVGKDALFSFEGIYDAINPEDTDRKIVEKVFIGNMKSLEDTLRILNRDALIRTAMICARAPAIIFLGMGGSGNIAQDAAFQFSLLGIQAKACVDSYQMLGHAFRMRKGNVAFGFSHSGRSAHTVKALELALRNGATTVGVSNYQKSPLHKVSTIFLCTSFPETRVKVAALSSKIAQMCVVDALYLLVARHMKIQPRWTERLDRHAEKLLRLRAR